MITAKEIRPYIGRKITLIKGSGEVFDGVVICYQLHKNRFFVNRLRVSRGNVILASDSKQWLDLSEFTILTTDAE